MGLEVAEAGWKCIFPGSPQARAWAAGSFNGVNLMRWKNVVAGLALTIAGATGCQQQCFIHECDYNHYQDLAPMLALETDPTKSMQPTIPLMPTPSTTDDPDRPLRFLTLAESIALALEQGTIGTQASTNPGFANDNLVAFTGRAATGFDSIRVLALDPAIVGADIESSLSKFDALWTTSMNWNTTDQPFTGFNFASTNTNQAIFNTSLLKPLPTGGVAGITFSTQYQFLGSVSQFGVNQPLNPSYTPRLQFQFEQPLLQGYGVEINQLRASHPGSILTPFQTGGRVEGIVITRLRFDQERAEFERQVHFMLLNVEIAYWNLYNSYWFLYSREQGLRQAYESWKINKAKYEAGRVPIQDYAQTRQQYELFRGQRLTALGQVLESERQLRGLLGLPREDGTRLIPVDAPTLTPYHPDWNTAVAEAMALRPELILAREDLKFRQLDLINQKNQLLPDLRFTSTYAMSGIGTQLDGSDSNAFRSLARDKFNDWAIGLRLTMPLGYRDAHSLVRVARLNLARSYLGLQDQELKAQGFLAQQYRHLFEFHTQIQIQRAQREAAATQLEARFKEFLAGRGTLDILLEAQRVWSDALRAEYDAIVQYNNALAGFEFAKGTILQRDNVVIAEGALPDCGAVRAVEHERQRSLALVLRLRPNPNLAPCGFDQDMKKVPQVPSDTPPPVPELSVPWLLRDKPTFNELTSPTPALKSTNGAGTIPSANPAPTPLPSAADRATLLPTAPAVTAESTRSVSPAGHGSPTIAPPTAADRAGPPRAPEVLTLPQSRGNGMKANNPLTVPPPTAADRTGLPPLQPASDVSPIRMSVTKVKMAPTIPPPTAADRAGLSSDKKNPSAADTPRVWSLPDLGKALNSLPGSTPTDSTPRLP
jgi:outer membrane protein TolC